MHDVPAVLSVWAPAVCWIALAGATANREMLFPYTVGFAAHLAIFGVSRLASQFPAVPLARIFVRAVAISGALVLVPYTFIAGLSARTMVLSIGGTFAVALGAIVFMLVQRTIRNTPQDARRWVLQAAAASIASMAAWLFALLLPVRA
jgi:hypothetical protein